MVGVNTTLNPVYILDAKRTPFGIANGVFKHIRAENLAAHVIQKIAEPINVCSLDHVILANAVGGGGNISRLAWLTAGGSLSTPCTTIDYQCGGSMQAIYFGSSLIASGNANLVLVGGTESVSTEPKRQLQSHDPEYQVANAGYMKRGRFSPDFLGDFDMIEAAEICAQNQNLTRQMLDQVAINSHKRANEEKSRSLLEPYIVPIKVENRIVNQDEGLNRKNISALIARVKSINPQGLLTAANTCLKNDGAGVALLCSGSYLEKHKIRPLAKLLGVSNTARNPIESSMAHVNAMEKCLNGLNLRIEDMSQIEVNEAFSSKWWTVKNHFNLSDEMAVNKINPLGGALAIGHPYSASGISLLIMLLANLKPYELGIAGMGVAGGQGCAMIIEKRI